MPFGGTVLASVAGEQPRGPQFMRITQLLRLPARQRCQPGFRFQRDRRLAKRPLCHKRSFDNHSLRESVRSADKRGTAGPHMERQFSDTTRCIPATGRIGPPVVLGLRTRTLELFCCRNTVPPSSGPSRRPAGHIAGTTRREPTDSSRSSRGRAQGAASMRRRS